MYSDVWAALLSAPESMRMVGGDFNEDTALNQFTMVAQVRGWRSHLDDAPHLPTYVSGGAQTSLDGLFFSPEILPASSTWVQPVVGLQHAAVGGIVQANSVLLRRTFTLNRVAPCQQTKVPTPEVAQAFWAE
eukprot:3214205-Amphidinium_carterae.1